MCWNCTWASGTTSDMSDCWKAGEKGQRGGLDGVVEGWRVESSDAPAEPQSAGLHEPSLPYRQHFPLHYPVPSNTLLLHLLCCSFVLSLSHLSCPQSKSRPPPLPLHWQQFPSRFQLAESSAK